MADVIITVIGDVYSLDYLSIILTVYLIYSSIVVHIFIHIAINI